MIKDVSPELYEAIKTEFEKKISGNSAIKSVMDSIESGNSTFRDAYKYAETLGDALAESFDKILSSDTLPDGKMYYNIAKAVVEPFLRENYEATADVAAQVQKVLNTKAKIGMNAITPEVDEDKTKGIIDYISNAEQFDNVKKSFVDSTLNYTQSAVDDTIEQNVDFHAKSGMNPVVTRITVGRVCDWCKGLAGVHKYPVDRDVYRRHENCRCIVEYDPGDGKKQDVWSKITYTEKESQERIKKQITGATFGAYNDKNDPKQEKRDAHAKRYYESIRNSDKDYIVNTISRNASISREKTRKAIDHLFFNKYNLDGELAYFDASYDIAESIRRLREGYHIQPHDITLINHEAIESDLMAKGMGYEEAHTEASKFFDYAREVLKWNHRND